jgi:MarR family 2-MHQ and catechol resistance regulon transcriptional repressor
VDPEFETALKLFTVLSRAHSALHGRAAEDVSRHDLTATEFSVLEALYQKGPLLHGEIADKILVSSGGVTYLVDRLAERGLLERRDCPGDRRARYVALTASGVQLMDRIFPEHARAIAKGMATLSPEQQRTLTGLLRALGKGAANTPPSALALTSDQGPVGPD